MHILPGRSIAVAALVCVTALLAPASARAACTTITITNNTTCTLDLTFTDGVSTYTVTGIVPGVGAYTPPPFTPTGIVTAFGNFVTSPAPGACTGCITLRVTGFSSTCCATLCHAGACKLTLNPVTCGPGCP